VITFSVSIFLLAFSFGRGSTDTSIGLAGNPSDAKLSMKSTLHGICCRGVFSSAFYRVNIKNIYVTTIKLRRLNGIALVNS
jgi:hypothetical protein